jgi:hypothetical protein
VRVHPLFKPGNSGPTQMTGEDGQKLYEEASGISSSMRRKLFNCILGDLGIVLVVFLGLVEDSSGADGVGVPLLGPGLRRRMCGSTT